MGGTGSRPSKSSMSSSRKSEIEVRPDGEIRHPGKCAYVYRNCAQTLDDVDVGAGVKWTGQLCEHRMSVMPSRSTTPATSDVPEDWHSH